MLRAMIGMLALLSMVGIGKAQTVEIIPTQGKVTSIIQTSAGSYVETDQGSFEVVAGGDCAERICLVPGKVQGQLAQAPKGALPDGSIATSDSGDIRQAWYAQPTDRYRHGVLGDAIEAGSLVVSLSDGRRTEFVLPENQVFEDITPRIADLNFDGTNEVVTIRASQTGGAAVVVYGLNGDVLVEVAASSENGQRNRWLNIAGILPQPEENKSSIYFIRTPHINGRLNRLEVSRAGHKDMDLKRNNFSNHVIGSRELALSALSMRGKAQLYIPSQNRRTLRQVLGQQFDIPVPGQIYYSVIMVGNDLLTATQNGQLLVIFD